MTVLLISSAAAQRLGAALADAGAGATLVHPDALGETEDVPALDAAYFSHDLWPVGAREFFAALTRTSSLRWLHTMSAGVDSPVFTNLMRGGTTVTTSSGVSAAPIAQTVLLYLLAFNKGLAAWSDAQRRRAWEPHDIGELAGSRVVIAGMGPIGFEVARLTQALGMDAVGVRRTVRGNEPCRTVSFDGLDTEMAHADHLVIALPLTETTRGLFTRSRLALLKPGATLINVGRGNLIDEPALIDALSSGRIAHAGLDVFATEPLPSESPLWDMSNVIITPHNSASSTANAERTDELFLSNLRRFVRSEPLHQVADSPAT